MLVTSFALLGAVASLLPHVYADANSEKVAKLKTASTQLERLDILSDDADWKFDFFKDPGFTMSPGSVVNANAKSFPAVTGNGMTMATLLLGGCAMLPPHYHPRATNYVFAFNGSTTTYMITENKARTVTSKLEAGQMTIFPAASLHSMQNNLCEPVLLISTLSSEDGGTNYLADAFFQLPDDITSATFKEKLCDGVKDNIADPSTGAVMGSLECRRRCGMA
ncbi:RmlC-like cupin [Aulographum hederae CBS 113979]|uniref:RmlC-like cupin n=1 Tax=Aulographum hederae CBS 113979 TaxID=1176131 RepID=A0A6G1GR96_9PEZI|nr:RmlC-like cupin [Aulographum hederae CBS 113979]